MSRLREGILHATKFIKVAEAAEADYAKVPETNPYKKQAELNMHGLINNAANRKREINARTYYHKATRPTDPKPEVQTPKSKKYNKKYGGKLRITRKQKRTRTRTQKRTRTGNRHRRPRKN